MHTTSYQDNGDGAVDLRRPMYRASTSPPPPPPVPAHPLALMPGHVPQTLDRPNLYFMNAARMPIAHHVRNVHIPSPPPVPLYPAYMSTHFQHPSPRPTSPPPRPPLPPSLSAPHPSLNIHRSFTSPPPIPPKPSSAPISPRVPPLPGGFPPNLGLYTLPETTSPEGPTLESPTDEGDIALALALSESVTKEERKLRQKLMSQEEDDIAKALKASLLETRNPRRLQMELGSAFASSSASAFSQPLQNVHSSIINACDDEALAHLLTVEQEDQTATPSAGKPPSLPSSDTNTDLTQPSPGAHYVMQDPGFLKSVAGDPSKPSALGDTCDDEAFARLLAAEQEHRNTVSLKSKAQLSDDYAATSASPIPPQYLSMRGENPLGAVNCDDDEVFARLSAVEEKGSTPSITGEASGAHHPRSSVPLAANTDLPCYTRGEFEYDESSTPVASSSRQKLVDDKVHGRPFEHYSSAPTRTSDGLLSQGSHSPSKAFNSFCYAPQSHASSTNWSSGPAGSSTLPHEGRDLVASTMAVNPPKAVAYPNLTSPSYADGASSSTPNTSHSSTSPGERPAVVVWKADQLSSECTASSNSPSPSSTIFSLNHHRLTTAFIPEEKDPSLTPAGSMSSMVFLSDHHDDVLDPVKLRPSPSAINLNAFVEKELFNGVSVGFVAPKISTQLLPMPDEMPPVILLPYGKARPLHLQGPSWRHLLKLMARLSGTRVEPSVDAVKVMETPLKLRTVVQFVKPHQTSPNWRTIFYFTIDYPSPEPDRVRGVNELPYSYSLAGIPTLLRDAADTPISKTYTIPASNSVPFPTLPISFPELALYLQAALEESRRYLHDSNCGNRKLAKMIKTCYPTEDVAQDPTERHSVGGLFKRVMGRSNKSNRGGGNEDTYELVTPFVPDEWG
ncbi:hypothetical protein D9615_000540 [Tricholomella constricta]|uniref:Uncharacterized protein n=1 Tax=Tricholomella constricta TaxID=117010 RepID=A0A8H5HRP3_9AGAR|nr:hypothetical protein D9615_000540 [Tricholomella constricta]